MAIREERESSPVASLFISDIGYYPNADRFMGPYAFVRNLQPEGYGVGDSIRLHFSEEKL